MQQLQITIKFKVKHSPENNEKHLHQVLKHYLEAKGITLEDNNEIWV